MILQVSNKLEEEKAKYSCQKVMFASVSHEFRTPLNAFDNSLNLIKMIHQNVQKDIQPYLDDSISIKIRKNSESIDKFI